MSTVGVVSTADSRVPVVSPLGRRLFYLLLVPTIPALGLVLYGNFEQRRIETVRAREGAAAISQLAAANQENYIKNSRQLLATLAEIPFLVQTTNPAVSQTHFSNLRKLLPDYVNFGLIESNGLVFCSAEPTTTPINLGDRSYFQRVVRTKRFATGDFQIGRITDQPALNFGYPILDARGRLHRVLFASLKISRLTESLEQIHLPPGGTVTVLDPSGNVLARYPDPTNWVGKALAGAPVARRILEQKQGGFTMPGLDGVPRLHAVTPIPDRVTPAMFVSVGIPVSVAVGYANTTLARNLFLLAVVATLTFATARYYAQRHILQPINALAGAAGQLATGDLTARAGAIHGANELAQLGRAFDDMAARLQQRQTEVAAANAQIQRLNRDLESRVQERTAQLESANKVLAHERHLLKSLMDNVPVDIYFKDRESRFFRNNQAHARRLGLGDPKEAVGKTDFDFFGHEHAAQARADELEVMASGQPVQKEELENWPDGRVSYVLTAKLPWRDEHGNIVGTFGISHDITERKQAEQSIQRLNRELEHRAVQLEEANKELASFSYSVSHDLRAPLRGIDGFSQALEEDFADKLDEVGRNYLARVRVATRRMAELIDDLLKLSQIARAEVQRRPVDLCALARAVSEELQKQEPHRSGIWEIADGLTAEGDPRLLRIALENLLGNAWKFTGKHPAPRIEVGRVQREQESIFFVRDNGAGFDMAHAAKLFGAFQRLHSQAEFEGTGIGLATVQRIVRRHGGRIWAEGEVDKGATIYFTL